MKPTKQIEKFKIHLREAKRSGWELHKILWQIKDKRCPFCCTICSKSCYKDEPPYYDFAECIIFKSKRDYHGEWKSQSEWYMDIIDNNKAEDLLKIVRETWCETNKTTDS